MLDLYLKVNLLFGGSNKLFEEDLHSSKCNFFLRWNCLLLCRSFSECRFDSFFFNVWQKIAALSRIISFEALSECASSGTQNLRQSKALLRSTLRCLSMELWRSRMSFTLSVSFARLQPLPPLSLIWKKSF